MCCPVGNIEDSTDLHSLTEAVLTSLVSGTVDVNDNKIQNICVYSSVNI